MASWKKVIVSGSAAELKAVTSSLGILIDPENAQSAGYMAISASSTSTASFGHLLGDASQLTNLPETEWDGSRDGDAEISGSLILTGSAGRIPSLEIAGFNEGVGNQKIGNTVATTILSGSFSGSFEGKLVGTAGVATKVTITDNENTNESNAIIFAADGALTGGDLGLESDGDLTYNPSTGGVTATSFTGSLKGATTGSHDGPVGANNADSGTFTTLDATGNVTLGSAVTDRVTIAGDLIVQGNTTEVQTTNLNVEDQLILLNSGSNGGTDAGIIFGGSSDTANSGYALGWHDSDGVFGISAEINSGATSIGTLSGKLGYIETSTSVPSSAPTRQGVGSIHVKTDDETIWIYS